VGQSVNGGVDQVLGAQLHARLADGEDLRVGGWIVGLGHLVGAFGEYFAALHDHRREWATARGDVPAGQLDCPLGKVGHGSSGAATKGNRPLAG
jgi:hypothetical protein